jgi:hypothetical protein
MDGLEGSGRRCRVGLLGLDLACIGCGQTGDRREEARRGQAGGEDPTCGGDMAPAGAEEANARVPIDSWNGGGRRRLHDDLGGNAWRSGRGAPQSHRIARKRRRGCNDGSGRLRSGGCRRGANTLAEPGEPGLLLFVELCRRVGIGDRHWGSRWRERGQCNGRRGRSRCRRRIALVQAGEPRQLLFVQISRHRTSTFRS